MNENRAASLFFGGQVVNKQPWYKRGSQGTPVLCQEESEKLSCSVAKEVLSLQDLQQKGKKMLCNGWMPPGLPHSHQMLSLFLQAGVPPEEEGLAGCQP